MATNFQQSPYLPQQRNYPSDELRDLANQSDQIYIDIAQKVNARTIGTFGLGIQIVTGEQWYLTGSSTKQQALREVFTFTSTAPITHNINFAAVTLFSSMYGAYTDGTNWYGLNSGTSVAIAGQITFYVTPTQVIFVVGAGAPALTKGNLVLQWVSVF